MQLVSEKRARRRSRSDKGTVLITERDRRVLKWIAEQYAVRFDDIHSLLAQEASFGAKMPGHISENAARQVIARWQRAGWASSRKILVADPAWVWVTPKGLRELGYSFKFYALTLSRIDHLNAINKTRLRVEREYPHAIWVSERQLHDNVSFQRGSYRAHMPDGYVQLLDRIIAIEVELTPKDIRILQKNLRELTENYQEVWYFVRKKVITVLTTALNELEPALAKRINIIHLE
jgi:hypothetical protein